MTGDTAAAAVQVDARGLKCPLPILRTKKALAAIGAGERIEVLSTDPTSVHGFEAFCRQTGHALLRCDDTEGYYRLLLQKRPATA